MCVSTNIPYTFSSDVNALAAKAMQSFQSISLYSLSDDATRNIAPFDSIINAFPFAIRICDRCRYLDDFQHANFRNFVTHVANLRMLSQVVLSCRKTIKHLWEKYELLKICSCTPK